MAYEYIPTETRFMLNHNQVHNSKPVPETILFISDLHLDPEHKKNSTAFNHFMAEVAPNSQAIYILGDLFECWAGADINTEFQQEIFDLLLAYQQLRPERKIFFMPGNRDFLFGRKECRKQHINFLQDPTLITLDHQAVLLSHGDSLCSLDHSYQRYRKIIQNKWMLLLLKNLPRTWRISIAKKLRAQSQSENTLKSNKTMDIPLDTVEKIMHQYPALTLIHGHTHQPNIHKISLSLSGTKKQGQRIVLGAWENCASYIHYQNGIFNLTPL